jgi:exodeoxyribonuclease VII large subunit
MGTLRLERRMRALSTARRARLEASAGRLEALSPLAVLARGYAVARTPDGRLLNRIDDFEPGMRFHLRVSDGTVAADAEAVVDRDTPSIGRDTP